MCRIQTNGLNVPIRHDILDQSLIEISLARKMAFIKSLPDNTTIVYGFVDNQHSPISDCRLPGRITTIAQCDGPYCSYAYDGLQTLYNHAPKRRVVCPDNVTHLASVSHLCVMMTSDKQLYTVSKFCFDRGTDDVRRVEGHVPIKALGPSVNGFAAIALLEDGTVARVMVEGDTVRLVETSLKFSHSSPNCSVSCAWIRGHYLGVVVWDATEVWYNVDKEVHSYSPEGVGIKTCAQQPYGYPLVLLDNNKLVNVDGTEVMSGVVEVTSGYYRGYHVVVAIDEQHNPVQVTGPPIVNIDVPVSMGNCPLALKIPSVKSAVSNSE